MFTWLLYNALCATPLALLALLARRLPRSSAALEHGLWLLVLVRLVLPPLPSFSQEQAASPSAVPAIISSDPTWGDAAVAWMTRTLGTDWSSGVSRLALALFAAVALFLVVREFLRVRWIQGRLRGAPEASRALRAEVHALARQLGVGAPAIRVLPEATSPFVWSLVRPVLVLPEARALPARTVLGHELAHLRRRDHWSAWLELVALVLHFWNPLFWLARTRLRVAAELACDAWVVQRFPAERRIYASALVDALERAHAERPRTSALHAAGIPRAVHAIGMDQKDFEERLRRILSSAPGPNTSRAARASLCAAGLLAVASLPGLAAPTLAEFRQALPALPNGVDRALWQTRLARADERLQLAPDDGAAQATRGMALLGLGRFDEAVRAFERRKSSASSPQKRSTTWPALTLAPATRRPPSIVWSAPPSSACPWPNWPRRIPTSPACAIFPASEASEILDPRAGIPTPGGVSDAEARPAPADRPRLDARATAWLLRQNERIRALDLEVARLTGELAASERIERASERYADRMEEKLDAARRREASLARALGYVEAQRDQLQRRLGGRNPVPLVESRPRPS